MSFWLDINILYISDWILLFCINGFNIYGHHYFYFWLDSITMYSLL